MNVQRRPAVRAVAFACLLMLHATVAVAAGGAIPSAFATSPSDAESEQPLAEVQAAAERGDRGAQYDLARRYLTGIGGVPQDDALTLSWAQRAADQDTAEAEYLLGILNWFGRGTPQDAQKACDWYEKAALKGLAQAQDRFGTCLFAGEGGRVKDTRQAATWYARASDQGLADAQADLAWCYQHGQGVPKDLTHAAALMRRAADGGSIAGMTNAAHFMETGNGTPIDLPGAVAMYRKAIAAGSLVAADNLGGMLLEGRGVAKDPRAGVALIRRAAEGGVAEAQFNYGLCFEQGLGVARDVAAAILWYDKASRQGHANAQYNYAVMVDKGLAPAHVAPEVVVDLYRQAAEHGLAAAQHNLGAHYQQGQGVPHDEQQAFEWFQRSATQGNALGMLALANDYYEGRGTIRNPGASCMWARRARDAHANARAAEVDRQIDEPLLARSLARDCGR